MGREGFEPPKPEAFDLQSNVVDHFTYLPILNFAGSGRFELPYSD